MASFHLAPFALSAYFQRISALVMCVLLLGQVDAKNRRNEVQALMDFSSNRAGVGYDFDGFWRTWNPNAENPCNWTGVICSTDFTVVELDLSGWEGGSPENFDPLADLRDLRHLDMSSSKLIGSFPETIGSLTGLIRLDLSHNQLSGRIPANISKCTSLQYISLEQNQLAGEIPSLSELVNLEILNLADNNLTGQFPKDLPELSSLVSIDLSRNMLNGSIPSLPKLINLQNFRLDDNNFTKFQEPWLAPPNLALLSVSGNQLGGKIPSSIANLTSLESLNMSNNRLSSVPSGFSQLLSGSSSVFASLDLSQNQLIGNILDLILPDSSAHQYLSVNLSQNNITGPIHIDGDKHKFYYVLDLSYNQLSGPIPSFVHGSIYTLRLQNNHLSGDIVDMFFSDRYIYIPTDLRLQNNLFTGDLSRMTCANASLNPIEYLDISNNNLQMTTTKNDRYPLKASLECFMQFPKLQFLDLGNSHLKGEILDTAFNSTGFPSLQLLDLSNNDLIEHVPENIVKRPNLASLNVANNGLSGPLPPILPTSSLYNPTFFAGNARLCGEPLPSCNTRVQWWQLPVIVGSMTVAIGSCLVATWRWRVYHKRHQQDADLIKTLMDKESATLMGLRDLKKATDNFADSAQIGEGGFGTVYTGKLNDGTRVAIKKSKREGSEKDKQDFLNEVKILSQVNHRHLVKLLGCCMENKIALLVFEYVSNGTLQEHLQGKFGDGQFLSWKQRLDIVAQTADALNYLHVGATFPIYHRDVKSANILVTDNLNAKVADFGISKLAPVDATHVSTVAIQGTMGYIDPEYYTSYQLTDKSDVYSFGVVLLEVISAKAALDFQRAGDETSLVNLANPCIMSGDLQRLIDPALEETYNDPIGRASMLHVGKLAMRCLDMRARARPSMNEVLVELKTISLQLDGTSEDLDFINDNQGIKYSQEDGAIAIQMSEFSSTESEILLNQRSNSESSIASPSNSSMVQRLKSMVHSRSSGK